MNKSIPLLAAAVLMGSASAKADDETDFRLEHRQHRLKATAAQNDEPNFFTVTGEGLFIYGINNLNRQQVGYGAGGKLNLHIGLESFEAGESRLSIGLELSEMFAANLTGGVYDGFVNNINADVSFSMLGPEIGWSSYAGTGLTLVDTIDPWLNHDTAAYANMHAGARLLFCTYGSLELEVGAVFNGEDSGLYAGAGLGVALPDIY